MSAPTHEDMCNALRLAIADAEIVVRNAPLVGGPYLIDWTDRLAGLRAALAELDKGTIEARSPAPHEGER